MKKGFTLLEVIVALTVSAVITYFAVSQIREHLFNQRLDTFIKNFNSIINYAIIDTKTGYVNGTGGYCSDDNTYKDMTSCRAINCADLNQTFTLTEKDNNCDKTPDDSYINNLMLTDTNGKGCYEYMKPDSDDDTIFYVFVDCSNLDTQRKKEKIENLLTYDVNANFNVILKKVYPDATSIDDFTGGDDKDGKIAFKFKK